MCPAPPPVTKGIPWAPTQPTAASWAPSGTCKPTAAAVILSAANKHDKTRLKAALIATVVKRPNPTKVGRHLCLDKGYDYHDTRQHVARRGYIDHIPKRGQPEPQRRHRKGKARRWVVERTNRWHNLFRRLKIRYEVHAQNYLGFVQ